MRNSGFSQFLEGASNVGIDYDEIVNALQNIGTADIDADEWSRLASLDQPVATTDDVLFNSVSAGSITGTGSLNLSVQTLADNDTAITGSKSLVISNSGSDTTTAPSIPSGTTQGQLLVIVNIGSGFYEINPNSLVVNAIGTTLNGGASVGTTNNLKFSQGNGAVLVWNGSAWSITHSGFSVV